MHEDEVIRRLMEHFRQRHYEILGFCLGRKTGVDLAVKDRSETVLFVEAKGIRNSSNKNRSRCQGIWDNGYARLPQLAFGCKRIRNENNELGKEMAPDMVGLAIPDDDHFWRHFERFERYMRHDGFGLWFVGDQVREVLPPRLCLKLNNSI